MSSIFTKTNDFVDKPNRNPFDLSFAYNGTFNFGALYPVLCKEVLPGDSFSIKPTFGLNLMPMAFPVQTRMQANLHFFYVRNRNLWKDWPDFIGKTKANLQSPYLGNTKGKIRTGSLHDYLNVPTTLAGNYGKMETKQLFGSDGNTAPFYIPDLLNTQVIGKYDTELLKPYSSHGVTNMPPESAVSMSTAAYTSQLPYNQSNFHGEIRNGITFEMNKNGNADYSGGLNVMLCVPDSGKNLIISELFINYEWVSGTTFKFITSSEQLEHFNKDLTAYYDNIGTPTKERYYSFIISDYGNDTQSTDLITNSLFSESYSFYPKSVSVPTTNRLIDVGIDTDYSPYYDAQYNPNSELKLSALPYRAYESIYNSFYRNQQNDPFKINGVPEYNKFIPTDAGGVDYTDYKLHYRNWEQDVLTTAMPSPQQGIAPLVGVTTLGDMTFKDENGVYHAKAKVGEDGDTITGVTISSNNMPIGTKQELMNLANSGITISDLRNVNSLQRWLEKNMRRGYRYKDQLLSHYGVDARYDALDMPEFLGGMSEPIYINKVDQTADTPDAPLGSYAGQGSILATSKHSINHYCDEHGFIIAILSVSPVPNYSQMLPKHFIKQDTLDYFFPEFGHIGMQPITYKQVTPIQSYNASSNHNAELNKVFGYQRAWYEYLSSTDEVHGLFRTSLRNFLINRVYDTPPQLGEDFLHVDPEQTNQIFTIQDVGDKIMGQIYFDIVSKRPIPTYGIPRLE